MRDGRGASEGLVTGEVVVVDGLVRLLLLRG